MKLIKNTIFSLSSMLAMVIASPVMASDDYGVNYDYFEFRYGETDVLSEMETVQFNYSSTVNDHVFWDLGLSAAQDDDEDRITYNRSELAIGAKYDIDSVFPVSAYLKGGIHYMELKNKDNPVYFAPKRSLNNDQGALFEIGLKTKPVHKYLEVSLASGVLRYNETNEDNYYYKLGVDVLIGDGVALTLSGRREDFMGVDVDTAAIGIKVSI